MHSRTQERYYKIISRTDGSGLAQSEFASGDLRQIDKHLLLSGGSSVGSVCGLTSVGNVYLTLLKMGTRRSFLLMQHGNCPLMMRQHLDTEAGDKCRTQCLFS